MTAFVGHSGGKKYNEFYLYYDPQEEIELIIKNKRYLHSLDESFNGQRRILFDDAIKNNK